MRFCSCLVTEKYPNPHKHVFLNPIQTSTILPNSMNLAVQSHILTIGT